MRASNPLEIRTAVVQIETAILEALRLAYFFRYPESQTLSELAQRDAFKLLYQCICEHCAKGTLDRSEAEENWRISRDVLEMVRKQQVERVQGVYRGVRPA